MSQSQPVTPARLSKSGFVEIELECGGVWIELTSTEAHTLLLVEPYNVNLHRAVEWANAVEWINKEVGKCPELLRL